MQLRTVLGLCLAAVAAHAACTSSAMGQSRPVRGVPDDALPELYRLEDLLRRTPDTALLREYMLVMSEVPHHAGSPASRAVAQYALSKFREWGLDAEIEEFEALMPTPRTRGVEMLSPTRFVAAMHEPEIPEDKDSGDENQLPTFNAYSADGDVAGELVFVNYGLPEDYEVLERMGIDVEGKIVLAKFGRSWRGVKPKVAAEHGAIGCIIYSDPEDDGYYRGDVYPRGPWRPASGVQRGSVMDWSTYPGDPLTPGWGAKPGGRKLDRSQARTLMSIPVLPISYGDAQPLLEALEGPVAPNDHWKGGLPVTYHLGPGPAQVRMHAQFDWQVRPLYDVIARIPGAVHPNQWIVHGNHHDAWVNGASDPVSGAVALMETARSFARLMESGWRPDRTLIFALWDGEEWGLLGSTEWAEEHADELQQKAVAYLNSDLYDRGPFGASGSHVLETFIGQIARDLTDPASGRPALDVWLERRLRSAATAEDSSRVRSEGFRLGDPGSGSDYTPFIGRLGLATVNMGHFGGPRGGIYHSIYDSYDHYTRFLDPGFVYGPAQSAAFSMAMLRLSQASLVPFSFSDAARTFGRYVDEIDELATREYGPANGLDLSEVRRAVQRLERAGGAFDDAFAAVMDEGSSWIERYRDRLRPIDVDIYSTERALLNPAGLPRREWFRHAIYAPGLYTGYSAKTMPGIRETVEWGDLPEAQVQAASVAVAVEGMAEQVEVIVRELMELMGR